MPDLNWIAEKGEIDGRRSGLDRRKLFIPGYTPERRSNQDRRSSQDRRSRQNPGNAFNLRRSMDRYMEFVNTQKGVFLAILMSIPIWAVIIFMIVKK